MFGALKRGRFRGLASLILVVNVVGELQRKRTLAASRGFLAATRLSCCFSCYSAIWVLCLYHISNTDFTLFIYLSVIVLSIMCSNNRRLVLMTIGFSVRRPQL